MIKLLKKGLRVILDVGCLLENHLYESHHFTCFLVTGSSRYMDQPRLFPSPCEPLTLRDPGQDELIGFYVSGVAL